MGAGTDSPYFDAIRNGRTLVDQSTAYTEIIEVSPNRLLLIYDRTASGWEATGKDSGEVNRIYVLPIEVARDR